MHRTLSPLVRQTGQLLRRYLINIRISHRHHIQDLTAERPPPLLTRTPIPTITDEPRRLETDAPTPLPARARTKPANTGSSDRKYSSIDTRWANGVSACGKPNASCGVCDRGTNPHPDTTKTPHASTPAALANTRLIVISDFPLLEHHGAGGNTAAGGGAVPATGRPRPRIQRALTGPPPARRQTHRIDPTGRSRPGTAGAGSAAWCPCRRPGRPPNRSTPPQSKATCTG